jgi:hypothetical protein
MMKSALAILFLSILWFTLFLVAGVFGGWITLSASPPWLMNPAAFAFRHLRMSIVPFGLLFLLYIYLIGKIRFHMRQDSSRASDLTYYDRLLNATISTFFGVGVIWTAVGMESALMHALDGIEDGRNSLSLSAWGILDRLVNGGLLLALSTTVFGGACGYLLRLLKIILLGKDWDRTILQEMGEDEQIRTAEG